ncbi:MAG: hypothetical protein E7604_07285 [Ruminococcaceae bacterium]|nr:hypothetical protein [Oscillospiraceae bacterium]
MKWLVLGAGAVCAALCIIAAVKAYRNAVTVSTDCIDGGVRLYQSGEDAPKTVTSTEITEFYCEFSLYADAEPGALGNGRYRCHAVLQDGIVKCSIRWHDRMGVGEERAFDADIAFMEQLHEIVSRYDLAKHNGYSYRVSGLPDMYGAELQVVYASGESIYAINNQDVFLEYEALNDLFVLFSAWKKETVSNTEG